MKKVLCVVGTRPDAIKMAPVILGLQECDDIECIVAATGQHKEMLQQVLTAFGIAAAENFGVMKVGQSLAYLTSSMLSSIDELLEKTQPEMVVAQGDTTTTLTAALGAFYRRIPFAHVEAGLRTDTVQSPFPEEFNRRCVGQVAALHFAPTEAAAENLLREGMDPNSVFVTGNTAIDAILRTRKQVESDDNLILLTTHRRENWGEPQANICKATVRLLDAHPKLNALVPMHKNPIVRQVLEKYLSGHPRVELREPPSYEEFVELMQRAHIILTDSGGVQEEAPSLGKPVLVLRSETERPEGIAAGNARLVGTDTNAIYEAAHKLLTDDAEYQRMARTRNPYGDGLAAKRIVAQIKRFLDLPYDDIETFRTA